ncbi:Protein C2-DOMAIN ABA-RELATED 4 [Linum perenne]
MTDSQTHSPAASPTEGHDANASPMATLLGLLRIHIKRGVNLAVRDVRSSDPYCVVKMGSQDVNPEWNEEFTLAVADPDQPVKLTVYDHDTFSLDDKMGDAEFEIKPFMEALEMDLAGLPNGTILHKIQPSRSNCLAEETCIVCEDGKVFQDMIIRLKHVECGEVELQLQWIDLPGHKKH